MPCKPLPALDHVARKVEPLIKGMGIALVSMTISLTLAACGGGSGSASPAVSNAQSDTAGNTAAATSTGTVAPAMEDESVWPPAFKTLPASVCSERLIGAHNTYDVGTGKTYADLNAVPWLSLVAGDVVNVHYRAEPYKTKIALRAQGTAEQPVYINGVTDSACNRPVIDGSDAVWANDAKNIHFGAYATNPFDVGIQGLGLITIYWTGSEMVDARNYYVPRYITVQNLKLTNARSNKKYYNSAGGYANYDTGAAAIYAVRVHHLTVENCEITENDNGVFTNTRGQSTADYSAYIFFRRNKIHLNGNSERSTEHNLYIQAKRTLYEGNFMGQARGGSTIKDRSSGTVVRFNYLQGSARTLDLVDTEEEDFKNVQTDPLYDHAWVYGNVIINDINLPLTNTSGTLAARPIHFGHDKNPAKSRKGSLFFYGNTYINRTKNPGYYQASVFQVGGNDDDYPYLSAQVEASGNIFWNDDGSSLWYFMASTRVGRLVLKGTNYVPTWESGERSKVVQMASRNANLDYLDSTGAITTDLSQRVWTAQAEKMIDDSANTSIVGDSRTNSPLLDSATLVPAASSPVLNRGVSGPSFTPTGATAANLKLEGAFILPAEGVLNNTVNSLITVSAVNITGGGIKARVTSGLDTALGAFDRP
jgi:hypothetical protein